MSLPEDPTSQWTPPEADSMRRYIKLGVGLLLLVGGIVAINTFVPNVITAVNLVNQLLNAGANSIYALIGLLFAGFIAHETLSKDGRIRQLFSQWYISVTNRAAWYLLEIDPLSPLKEEKRNAMEQKAKYDDVFSKFDGALKGVKDSEDEYRGKADEADLLAQAAKRENDAEALDRAAGDFAEFNKAADEFKAMRLDLEPTRDDLGKIRGLLLTTVKNIDRDMEILSKKWQIHQNVSDLNKAARQVLKAAEKSQLAQEAVRMVKTKYADSRGRLENLMNLTTPMLQTDRLRSVAAREQLLRRWNAEAPLALAPPVEQVPLTTSKASAEVTNLLRRKG